MNVLITGARGFIGSYYCAQHRQTQRLLQFSFLRDSLSELSLTEIDVVVHLSGLVHQMEGADRSEYDRINVGQTIQLAQRAKLAGVKHFIFMSTVKVYGEENIVPYAEGSECFPCDDYGKSKLFAENELRNMEAREFIVSIIRTPIVYGYGVKANIEKLISLIKRVPLLPLGGIHNRRSMVYVGNLCHLIEVLIERRRSGIFIAGDDVPVSTTALVKAIAGELSVKRCIIKVPLLRWALRIFCQSLYRRLFLSLEVDNAWTKSSLQLVNPYSTADGVHQMIHGDGSHV